MKLFLWDADDYLVTSFNSLKECIDFVDGFSDPESFTITGREASLEVAFKRSQVSQLNA